MNRSQRRCLSVPLMGAAIAMLAATSATAQTAVVPQGSNVVIAPGAPPPPPGAQTMPPTPGALYVPPPGAGIRDRTVPPAEVYSTTQAGHWELLPDGHYVWRPGYS